MRACQSLRGNRAVRAVTARLQREGGSSEIAGMLDACMRCIMDGPWSTEEKAILDKWIGNELIVTGDLKAVTCYELHLEATTLT